MMSHMDPRYTCTYEKTGLRGPQDPISCYTHLAGAVMAAVGLFFMLMKTTTAAVCDPTVIVSTTVFCVSMIALYTASGVYHYVREDSPYELTFRKIDHSMIYVLIAGSYTPILLNLFERPQGTILFMVIWAIALAGVAFKVFWFRAPRWLSTAMYLAMGWFILIDLHALTAMATGGIVLLALGGVFYTIGGIIYGVRKPNISEAFGFHELFHVFVMLGSLCHYFCVYFFIA